MSQALVDGRGTWTLQRVCMHSLATVDVALIAPRAFAHSLGMRNPPASELVSVIRDCLTLPRRYIFGQTGSLSSAALCAACSRFYLFLDSTEDLRRNGRPRKLNTVPYFLARTAPLTNHESQFKILDLNESRMAKSRCSLALAPSHSRFSFVRRLGFGLCSVVLACWAIAADKSRLADTVLTLFVITRNGQLLVTRFSTWHLKPLKFNPCQIVPSLPHLSPRKDSPSRVASTKHGAATLSSQVLLLLPPRLRLRLGSLSCRLRRNTYSPSALSTFHIRDSLGFTAKLRASADLSLCLADSVFVSYRISYAPTALHFVPSLGNNRPRFSSPRNRNRQS